MFRLPPETAHARICIRILWLSTSPMVGKGHWVTISCYPLREPLLRLLILMEAREYTLRDKFILVGATPRPLVKPDYMSVTSYFGRKKSLRWNWKGTEMEPALAAAGIDLPSGMASTTHGLSCPKNTELNALKAPILGAHFRGLLCRFSQMTLCKTGATSTQGNTQKAVLGENWSEFVRVISANLSLSVSLHN